MGDMNMNEQFDALEMSADDFKEYSEIFDKIFGVVSDNAVSADELFDQVDAQTPFLSTIPPPEGMPSEIWDLYRQYAAIKRKYNSSVVQQHDPDELEVLQTYEDWLRTHKSIQLVKFMPLRITPNTLVLFAGPSGTGKTTFASQIFAEQICEGKRVLYFTNEVQGTEISMAVWLKIKFMARMGLIRDLQDVKQKFKENVLMVDLIPKPGSEVMSAAEYPRMLAKYIDAYKPDVVIVDQLNNIELSEKETKDRKQKWQMMNELVRSINYLCQQFSGDARCPVWILFQQKSHARKSQDSKGYSCKELLEGSKQTYNYAHLVIDLKITSDGKREYHTAKVRNEANCMNVRMNKGYIPVYLPDVDARGRHTTALLLDGHLENDDIKQFLAAQQNIAL
jgi:ABC-type branched-subunit amino acid transport system ATPase component